MNNRKTGFTLVELLVVLALVAVISSITFGAFRSISDGNKRTSCQSNMAQIYKSVRLYAEDFDGKYPYLNPRKIILDTPATSPIDTDFVAKNGAATPAGGIGLWGLYTFRIALRGSNDDLVCPNNDVVLPFAGEDAQIVNMLPTDPRRAFAASLSGYVRSPKIFHCPADRYEKEVQYRPKPGDACVVTPEKVADSEMSFADNDNPDIKRLNPAYLSYQTNDDTVAIPGSSNDGKPRMAYSSFRLPETAATGRVRQLSSFTANGTTGDTSTIERPTEQATVLAWCRFHRNLDEKTRLTKGTGRNFDNVLFSDGTVQSLPMSQTVTGSTNPCTGWQRVRREIAESATPSGIDCTP